VKIKYAAAIIITALLTALPLQAQDDIVVRAAIEKRTLEVGIPIRFQVQVQGVPNATPPDTAGIAGFNFQYQGGSAQNRSYQHTVNGQTQTRVFTGFIMDYQLTALTPGELKIPALAVQINGKAYYTQPITVSASKPAESTTDFLIRMKIGKNTAYVGQPIPLTLTWYLSKKPEQCNLNLPVLNSPEFEIGTPPEPEKTDSGNYAKLPLNGQMVLGELGQDTVNGKDFQTVSVTRYIIPTRPGEFKIEPATVSCSAVTGYKKSARRSPFSDMFNDDFFGNDPFFSGRQAIVKNFFNSSEAQTLNVLALPEKGKPANFSGLVGEYIIASKVEPANASVGEPITLTTMISGIGYTGNITMPDIESQADFARDFKLSNDKPETKVVDAIKIFKQQIRAKHADIKEVPPIRLSFFNPQTGNYQIVSSQPMPVHIKAAKIVTLNDIEGSGPISTPGTVLKSTDSGIMHNYTGESCLISSDTGIKSWLHSPGWLTILLLPPAAYIALLILTTIIRKREENSGSRRSGQALKKFKAATKVVTTDPAACQKLLDALYRYFSDRLHIESVTITFNEIEGVLNSNDVDKNLIANLKKAVDHCEASRYAGGAVGQAVSDKFVKGIVNIIEETDRQLSEVIK